MEPGLTQEWMRQGESTRGQGLDQLGDLSLSGGMASCWNRWLCQAVGLGLAIGVTGWGGLVQPSFLNLPPPFPFSQAVEEDIPKQKEQTHFTVRLTEAKPVDKVKLIKEIKNFVQGINLVQAKKLVESLPQEIKANVAKAEAEKIKAALEAVGGTVVLE